MIPILNWLWKVPVLLFTGVTATSTGSRVSERWFHTLAADASLTPKYI